VERFHRNLKDALRARLRTENWFDELPWVLLGIRTAPKEDLQTSSAELVYGGPLVVPGEFLSPQEPTALPEFLQKLRQTMSNLHPVPTSHHGPIASQVPKAVATCEFVFIRKGMLMRTLQRPYEGPFRVIARTDKTVTVLRGTSQDVVTLDRVKPAYTETLPRATYAQKAGQSPISNSVPVTTTRKGRPVNLPTRFRQ